MLQKSLFLLTLSISILACNNNDTAPTEGSPVDIETNIVQANTDTNTVSDTNETSNSSIVEQVALSFHTWYINSINDDSYSIVNGFEITENADGKCALDGTAYFRALKELGTISEKFMMAEIDRTKECASFLKSLDWSDFKVADAYEYQDYCDIYAYYWIRSQEAFQGVEVKSTKKISETSWIVKLVFYYSEAGKVYSEYSMPLVHVDKEKNDWRITKIEWAEKN